MHLPCFFVLQTHGTTSRTWITSSQEYPLRLRVGVRSVMTRLLGVDDQNVASQMCHLWLSWLVVISTLMMLTWQSTSLRIICDVFLCWKIIISLKIECTIVIWISGTVCPICLVVFVCIFLNRLSTSIKFHQRNGFCMYGDVRVLRTDVRINNIWVSTELIKIKLNSNFK